MKHNAHFLLNWPFVIGLLLLLINDHFLKDIFGNWFTGKLSDFAGVMILPLFQAFLFSWKPWQVVMSTVVFFVFWKSSLSGIFIDFYNTLSPISISRVVDYSDLLAFAVLPLSYAVLQNPDGYLFRISQVGHQKWAGMVLFFICTLAFVATSQEDEFPPEVEALFVNCCTGTPFVAAVGAGNVFIPNAFTPDGDGINDFFQISADTGIMRIDTMEIYDQIGGGMIFSSMNITDISPTTGWDGTITDTIVAAQYTYHIILTSTDSVRRTFSGIFCSIPCDNIVEGTAPLNLGNCIFSTQLDIDTWMFDSSTPSQEDLDCF